MSVSHIKIASLRHFTPVHFSLPFPPPPPPSANITGSRPRGKCKRDGKSETRLRFFRPESPIALGTSPLGPSSGSSSVHLSSPPLLSSYNPLQLFQVRSKPWVSPFLSFFFPASPHTPQLTTSSSVHIRVFRALRATATFEYIPGLFPTTVQVHSTS